MPTLYHAGRPEHSGSSSHSRNDRHSSRSRSSHSSAQLPACDVSTVAAETSVDAERHNVHSSFQLPACDVSTVAAATSVDAEHHTVHSSAQLPFMPVTETQHDRGSSSRSCSREHERGRMKHRAGDRSTSSRSCSRERGRMKRIAGDRITSRRSCCRERQRGRMKRRAGDRSTSRRSCSRERGTMKRRAGVRSSSRRSRGRKCERGRMKRRAGDRSTSSRSCSRDRARGRMKRRSHNRSSSSCLRSDRHSSRSRSSHRPVTETQHDRSSSSRSRKARRGRHRYNSTDSSSVRGQKPANRNSALTIHKCESSSVTIGTVNKTGGKRLRDKKLVCFVCKQQVLWLSRHLQRQHAENFLVARVMSQAGHTRRQGQQLLKNLGSFQHNVDVLKRGSGEIVVVRRTDGKHSAESYMPCTNCFGFYYQYDLWRHKCPSKNVITETKSTDVLDSSRTSPGGCCYTTLENNDY